MSLHFHQALVAFGLGLSPSQSTEPTQRAPSSAALKRSLRPKIRVQAWQVAGAGERMEVELPRVRFGLDGAPFQWLDYKLQLALEDDLEVKDAEVILHLEPGISSLSIGRRKLPTYREFVTSSGKLALVERSFLHDSFDGSRGVGVALEGDRVRGSGWSYSFGGWADEMDRRSFQARAAGAAHPPEEFLLAMGGRVSYGNHREGRFEQLDLVGGPVRWDVGVSANHSLANEAFASPGRSREALDYRIAFQHVSLVGDVHSAQTHDGSSTIDGFGVQHTTSYVWRGWLAPAARGALLRSKNQPMQYEATLGLSLLSPRRAHQLKLVVDASLLSENQRRARAMVQVAL